MRWVFYSLLVINLVYLGLQLSKRVSPEYGQVVVAPAAPMKAGSQLALLSESPQPKRAPVASPVQARMCSVLGPWQERDSALAATAPLGEAGLHGEVKSLLVESEKLSWVYLPAYGDRNRALAVLQELQERGVDSFLVKEGDDANAISLGYFSSEESAEGLRVKMRNAGYPAFVRDSTKALPEYWYLFAQEGQESTPEIVKIIEENQLVDLGFVACSSFLE